MSNQDQNINKFKDNTSSSKKTFMKKNPFIMKNGNKFQDFKIKGKILESSPESRDNLKSKLKTISNSLDIKKVVNNDSKFIRSTLDSKKVKTVNEKLNSKKSDEIYNSSKDILKEQIQTLPNLHTEDLNAIDGVRSNSNEKIYISTAKKKLRNVLAKSDFYQIDYPELLRQKDEEIIRLKSMPKIMNIIQYEKRLKESNKNFNRINEKYLKLIEDYQNLDQKYNEILEGNNVLKNNYFKQKVEYNETKSKLKVFREEYLNLEKSLEIENSNSSKNQVKYENAKKDILNLRYQERIIELENNIVILKEENEFQQKKIKELERAFLNLRNQQENEHDTKVNKLKNENTKLSEHIKYLERIQIINFTKDKTIINELKEKIKKVNETHSNLPDDQLNYNNGKLIEKQKSGDFFIPSQSQAKTNQIHCNQNLKMNEIHSKYPAIKINFNDSREIIVDDAPRLSYKLIVEESEPQNIVDNQNFFLKSGDLSVNPSERKLNIQNTKKVDNEYQKIEKLILEKFQQGKEFDEIFDNLNLKIN